MLAEQDWISLGIVPDKNRELINNLTAHNESILAKLDQFPEIITTSHLKDKKRIRQPTKTISHYYAPLHSTTTLVRCVPT